VALDARGQDLPLEQRGDERRALQRLDGVEDGVEAAALAGHALPGRDEPSERGWFDRLDPVPHLCQPAAGGLAEDAWLAPLAMGAAGTEVALVQTAGADGAAQRLLDNGLAQREPAC